MIETKLVIMNKMPSRLKRRARRLQRILNRALAPLAGSPVNDATKAEARSVIERVSARYQHLTK